MSDAHPIVAKLPEASRATFSRLMARTVRSPAAMRQQIPHYVGVIERAAASGYGPPLQVGRAIATDCEALLDAWDRVGDDNQTLIRAAVEYFLLSRDGDDDLATPQGLDDDAIVVQTVRQYLGV